MKDPDDLLHYGARVGDSMKGMVINGELVAWDIGRLGYPEHDTFDEDGARDIQITNMASAINIISALGSVPMPIEYIGDILGLFEDYKNDTQIDVSINWNRHDAEFDFRGTVGQLKAFFKHNPPPDPNDYDDGLKDADFESDYKAWCQAAREKKTVRQILGRGGRDDVWQNDDADTSKGFSVYNNPKRRKR